MITFAPTTSRTIRFGENSTNEDKTSHLDRLRSGLQMIERNTSKISLADVSSAELTTEGILGDYRLTKEGFSTLCSRLSPNTFSFLKGIDNADMGNDNKTHLQTKLFNEVWKARKHELDGMNMLVDTSSNKIEAIHSASYGHIPNTDALEMTLSNITSTDNLAWYKLHGRTLDVGISDDTKTILVPTARKPEGETITVARCIKNSEDGRSRFSIMLGLYTFICENGMRLGQEFNIVNAIHRSNILENVKFQLRNANDMDMSRVMNNIQLSSTTHLTDELRARSYSYLKDLLGSSKAKEFTSDEVAFTEGKVPTIYEVHSAITEHAHKNISDVTKQAEYENIGFKYLTKMVA